LWLERETPFSSLRYLAGIPIYGKGFGRKGHIPDVKGKVILTETRSAEVGGAGP
jgi:hypothetical protein